MGKGKLDDLDVVVVGSCAMDLICYSPNLPRNGETTLGTHFKNGFGGKGGNQCIAARNLGGKCLLVTKIGNDFFGKSYFNNLILRDIPREFVMTTEDAPTGVAQITVSERGENQIVIVPGANGQLNTEDVIRAAPYIKSCKVLVCQLEIPELSTVEALEIKAKSKTGISILNAAPAFRNLNPLLFSLPDIFCVNETEAEVIVQTMVRTVGQAMKAIKKLYEKGCKEVIITLGEQGLTYGNSKSEEIIHIPAKTVPVTDTTGAGDAFIGAMACLLAKNPNIGMVNILKKAILVAGFTVQHHGTQDSYPFLEDLPTNFMTREEV